MYKKTFKKILTPLFTTILIVSLFANSLIVSAQESDYYDYDAHEEDVPTAPFNGGSSEGVTKIIQETEQRAPTLPDTDPFTGAFVYKYNLDVPPGRNNLTPNLNLLYNSNDTSPDYIAGYGWSFDVPYISRINRYGSDTIYDHNEFTSSLSGKLINISGIEYGTRVEDGGFIKYSFDNDYWIAYDKEGAKYTFGKNTSSRQDDPNNSSRTYKWMLEEIRDTNDNYIKYEYFKDKGQIYPLKITYTGHGTTDGIFVINFSRESFNTGPELYHMAFKEEVDYRIDKIEITENGNLVHKYEFDYINSDSGARQLLEKITESGHDAILGQIIVKDPVVFTYQARGPIQWTKDTSWALPWHFWSEKDGTAAMRILDINGDAYPDFIGWHYKGTSPCANVNHDQRSYTNNTDGTWTLANCNNGEWRLPHPLSHHKLVFGDTGSRLFDYNGDMFVDFVYAYGDQGGNTSPDNVSTSTHQGTKTNTWVYNASVKSPIPFVRRAGHNMDNSTQILDINGDGIQDIIYAYHYEDGATGTNSFEESSFIGDGTKWTETTSGKWEIPWAIIGGHPTGPRDRYSYSQFMDLNADGLVDFDFKHSRSSYSWEKVALNTGSTWTTTNLWSLPRSTQHISHTTSRNSDNGTRSFDVNGDGIVDFVRAKKLQSQAVDSDVYLNSGTSFSHISTAPTLPLSFSEGDEVTSRTVIADINADGLSDLLIADVIDANGNNNWTLVAETYLATGTPFTDMLIGIETPEGLETDVEYKMSTKYFDGSGDLLNPNLPIMVKTVSKITIDDGLGNTSNKQYTYADGHWYHDGPYDKEFAGFGLVTETDEEGYITKTYYHQGNDSNTTLGEYDDHRAKIGRNFRTERYDDSGNLYQKTINKWDRENLGTNHDFVKKLNTVVFNHDGGSSNVETATEYTYDSYGNTTQEIKHGIVDANNDGTFTDTGNDKRTIKIAYTTNSTSYIVGLPERETLKDYLNNNVSVTDTTYDVKGNPTKISKWISGTDYADTNLTYNTYGLINTQTDPGNDTTTYIYDSYNMYPEKITNALGQDTNYLYDYSSGQSKSIIDDNGNTELIKYDVLDRPIEIKRTVNNSTPQTVETFEYNITSIPHHIKKTVHHDTSNTQDNYEYRDGLGRTVQTKSKMDSGYQTVDTIYDSLGQIIKQSLPYETSSDAYSSPTSNNNLLTTNSYDPMGRITQSINAKGTTSYTYNGFSSTVTDAENNQKGFLSDAFGNLIQVTEDLGGINAITNYIYNPQNLVTRIEDAMMNFRTVSYDGLGRRTSLTDLHTQTDTTYGIWNFMYNDENLISQSNPNGTIVNFSYDTLDRITSEDDTNTPSITEVVYSYDTCTNGVGKLCSATTPNVATTYTYYDAGTINTETRTINLTPYTTSYKYNRRGNVVETTHPNSDVIEYMYNTRGLQKELKYNSTSLGTMNYGVHGRPISQTHSNGASSSYSYNTNKLYELTNKTTLDNLSNTLQDINYEYDNVGNITKITDNGSHDGSKIQNFTYDNLYRLTQVATTNTGNGSDYTRNYNYDNIGNITAFNGVNYNYIDLGYTNPHAVTSIGTTNLTYDNNGNMTTDGTWTHSWNYDNTLSNSSNGTDISNYSYDHNKDRVKLIENSTITYYINPSYEIENGIQKISLSLNNTPITTIDDASGIAETSHIHTDHLGGTQLTTDKTGSISKTLDYYPYGDTRIDQGTNVEKKQYTGYTKDESTGLHYAGARYYGNSIGRFLSQDPYVLRIATDKKELQVLLLDPQRWNTYAYALNNPIRFQDNNGENAKENNYGHLGNLAVAIQYEPNIGKSLNQVLQNIADGGSVVFGILSLGVTDAMSAISGKDVISGREIQNQGTSLAVMGIGSITGGVGDDVVKSFSKLPIVKGAIPKLNKIVKESGLSKQEILEQASRSTKYVDHRNSKNINSFIDKPNSPKKMLRITTNPEQTRIISAGTVERKSVINNIKKKRFTRSRQ